MLSIPPLAAAATTTVVTPFAHREAGKRTVLCHFSGQLIGSSKAPKLAESNERLHTLELLHKHVFIKETCHNGCDRKHSQHVSHWVKHNTHAFRCHDATGLWIDAVVQVTTPKHMVELVQELNTLHTEMKSTTNALVIFAPLTHTRSPATR